MSERDTTSKKDRGQTEAYIETEHLTNDTKYQVIHTHKCCLLVNLIVVSCYEKTGYYKLRFTSS